MTSPATQHPDTDRRLGELVAAERDAWGRYLAEVHELDGPAYAQAEPAAWDTLQAALAEVAAERAGIVPAQDVDAPTADPDR